MARRKLWRRPNAIDDDPYRWHVTWHKPQRHTLTSTNPQELIESDAIEHWGQLRQEHNIFGKRTQKRPESKTKSYKEYIGIVEKTNWWGDPGGPRHRLRQSETKRPIESQEDYDLASRLTPYKHTRDLAGRSRKHTPEGKASEMYPIIDYWKTRHRDSVKEYKKWEKILARGRGIPISPQLRKTDQRWRVSKHSGAFSQLGPMGPFTENVIIEIELLNGLTEILALMFRSINTVQLELAFMSAIENRIIKPVVREGIEQITRLVPMMSGNLRETMIDTLRAYVNFEGGAKRFAKVSMDTFGVNYARPVNKMPVDNLKHINKFRKRGSRMFYLQDPEAETDFFGTIVENLRILAKEKYELFIKNYVLPRLVGHRPLTPQERDRESPAAMNTYAGFQEEYSFEEQPNIMGESSMFDMGATRERDYDIMKGVDSLLNALIVGGDSRITNKQKMFVNEMLTKAGRRGEKGLSSIQFAKLLFKVKFYGGTYK